LARGPSHATIIKSRPLSADCHPGEKLDFTTQKGARAVADPNDLQRNYKEFLDLLPLTLALAGLPQSDTGKYYTEEQIESRVFNIKHAYKAARAVARECIQK
jgi:hypothetical protein